MAEPFKSELDWSPKSWFSKRVAKPDGTKYTENDVRILNSHVPEYLEIEKKTLKLMEPGLKCQMDLLGKEILEVGL